MKRFFLLSLIISYFLSGAQAAPISSAYALDVARNFLAARGIDTSSIHNVAIGTRATSPGLAEVSNAAYHIFNIGENNGFIIIAGDDRVSPVLGYSLEGCISPETMPDACAAWLDATANAISDISDFSVSKHVTYPDFAVAPLLKSRWDQSDPYNRKCPIDKSTGLRTVTGCVATAAAQVMNYYKYPVQPVGKVEYEDKLQNENRTFNFSAMSPIDWDNISYKYTSEASDKKSDAIAELMNAVAHGSRMQFSSESSMAYNYNAGHALIEFFGYHPDMHYYERALISDEEWISVITSELQAGRPVLYEGRNHAMGHAFVCDGYDGDGFFHINWGWSGLSDGYFSLSALTPPSQSTGGSESGYSLSQTILCNIAPKETPGLLPQETGLLNIDKLYFRDSSDFHSAADNNAVVSTLTDALLFFYSFNKGMKPFSGEVCAAMTDSHTIIPLSTVDVNGLSSMNYTAIRFPIASMGLSDGTYNIGFYYRTSPSGTWHPVSSSTPGAPSQCSIIIAGDQVTMNAVNPRIMPGKVSSIDHSRLYTNSNASLSFELVNAGSMRLEAYAGVAFMQANGKHSAFLTIPILCPAEDKVTVEIETLLKGIPAGEYLLMPFYSYSDTPEATDIHPLADTPFPAVVEGLVLTPASGAYFMIAPDKPRIELNVTNMLALDWSAPVVAEITSGNGDSVARLPESQLSLGPLATAAFGFDCSGLALARGSYKVRFLIPDETPFLIAEFPMMVTADMASVSSVETDDIEIDISGDITITSPEPILTCTLLDYSGCIISDIRPNGRSIVISADRLMEGIYILRIGTESKTLIRKIKL